MKREDYLSWHEFFMAVAKLAALRSKDPSTQVGACIVNTQNRIESIGYNGFPNGCLDDDLPWQGSSDFLDSKYSYVVHAESNTILSAKKDLAGTIMYVSLFPCNECAKLIIQAGIKKVYYLSDKYHDEDFTIAARRMFDLAGIEYEQLQFGDIKINIDLE